jgi:hypothetical protein
MEKPRFNYMGLIFVQIELYQKIKNQYFSTE